jgi:hypothetical protein
MYGYPQITTVIEVFFTQIHTNIIIAEGRESKQIFYASGIMVGGKTPGDRRKHTDAGVPQNAGNGTQRGAGGT